MKFKNNIHGIVSAALQHVFIYTVLSALIIGTAFFFSGCKPSMPNMSETARTKPETGYDTVGIGSKTGNTDDRIPRPQDHGIDAFSEYEVHTADELAALSVSDELYKSEHTPRITICSDIEINQDIVFNRAAFFIVNSKVSSTGAKLYINDKTASSVAFYIDKNGSLEGKYVRVNAPKCDLWWDGNYGLPTKLTVDERMNVKSFNGEQIIRTVLGGDSDAEILSLSVFKDNIELSGFSYNIDGNIIEVKIPYSVSDSDISKLSVRLSCSSGCKYSISSSSPEREKGLEGELFAVLSDSTGQTRGYSIRASRVTYDLPVVYINTAGHTGITSKLVYTDAVISIDSQTSALYNGLSLPQSSMKIRGRGNSSWFALPKKGYRLKLDKKASLFGLTENRDWVLVPSYADKSLIRNVVASAMSKQMENIMFTPTHVLVDVFLNGEYIGVYTLADKIEIGRGRVDIETSDTEDDTGYLLEVGWNYEEEMIYGKEYFDTQYVKRICVKEPEITQKYTSQMQFIMDYVKKAEAAIIARSGYEEYIDVDALIDWLIIHEFTNNTESAFYRSCYMFKTKGGKIEMGPVWDFDMSFGNFSGDIPDYNGWAISEAAYDYVGTTWATFLMKDPEFKTKFKERWNEKKESLLKAALDTVNESVKIIDKSKDENFRVWNIMGKLIGEGNVNYRAYNTYELQIQYLVNFINTRYAWIDDAVAEF